MKPRVSPFDRLRAVNPLIVDTLLALGLAAMTLVELSTLADAPGVTSVDVRWSVLFLLLETLPLALRRHYPFTVLTIVGAARIAYTDVLNIPPDPYTALFAVLLAIYTVAAYARRDLAIVAGIIAGAATLVLNIPDFSRTEFGDSVAQFVWIGGAWVLGDNARYRRRQAALLRERAERAEREREDRARVAALEERTRIAREIHDVVAHSVSVITVQAGAARTVVRDDPDRATQALASIEEVSRDTMAELRRALGVLRAPAERAVLAPQPGIDRLDDLVEQLRGVGLSVDVTREGTPRELPSGLDLSVYRVVQEALTNTLKHAGAGMARVNVCYGADRLEVTVTDDGSGSGEASKAGPLGAGQGLVGMRERVSMFGGTLESGAVDGGFSVRATFPLG